MSFPRIEIMSYSGGLLDRHTYYGLIDGDTVKRTFGTKDDHYEEFTLRTKQQREELKELHRLLALGTSQLEAIPRLGGKTQYSTGGSLQVGEWYAGSSHACVMLRQHDDVHGIQFVFVVCSFLPAMGLIGFLLPSMPRLTRF